MDFDYLYSKISQMPLHHNTGTQYKPIHLYHLNDNNRYINRHFLGIQSLEAFLVTRRFTLIPLFFNKIKIDPAVASGPLITTVNDLVAVVTYYGLAWILLIEIMHIV